MEDYSNKINALLMSICNRAASFNKIKYKKVYCYFPKNKELAYYVSGVVKLYYPEIKFYSPLIRLKKFPFFTKKEGFSWCPNFLIKRIIKKNQNLVFTSLNFNPTEKVINIFYGVSEEDLQKIYDMLFKGGRND